MTAPACSKGQERRRRRRFFNNILIGNGESSSEVQSAGSDPVRVSGYGQSAANPTIQLMMYIYQDRVNLVLTLDDALLKPATALVTAALLGKATIPGLPYENPDGSPVTVATDYFGKRRDPSRPTPGPFEKPGTGRLTIQVWPVH